MTIRNTQIATSRKQNVHSIAVHCAVGILPVDIENRLDIFEILDRRRMRIQSALHNETQVKLPFTNPIFNRSSIFPQISLNLVISWQFHRCVLDMCALRNSMQNLCVIRGTTFTRKRFAEYKICINMLIKARMADVCAERRAHDLARTTRG